MCVTKQENIIQNDLFPPEMPLERMPLPKKKAKNQPNTVKGIKAVSVLGLWNFMEFNKT